MFLGVIRGEIPPLIAVYGIGERLREEKKEYGCFLVFGFLSGNKKVLNLFSSLVGSSLLSLAYL